VGRSCILKFCNFSRRLPHSLPRIAIDRREDAAFPRDILHLARYHRDDISSPAKLSQVEVQMRALVLDDAAAARIFLRDILVPLDFEVFEAADGIEGMDCLKAHGKLDVAFVDLNMPNMDGFEFTRAVRENDDYDAMPLIIVTTETGMDKLAECLEAQANEYVMKPYTKEVIEDKLTILGLL